MQKLLLLHGAIGSSEQMLPLLDVLKNNFDVHSLDFSGHGGKAIPDAPFSIKLFAADVLGWMDDNKINSIDIFGYSMGGYVALYIAKHFPSRIGRVFTLATKFEWNQTIAEKESGMLVPEKIIQKIPSFARALETRHYPSDWKIVLQKTAAMMLEMGKENPLSDSDFSSIENQIIISIGDKDKMVSLEETINVYRKLKNAGLSVFSNTQHPIENMSVKKISDAIKDFFG